MVSSLYLLLGAAAPVLAARPHAHAKRQDNVSSSATKTVTGAVATTSLDSAIDPADAQGDYIMGVCSPNYMEYVNKARTVNVTEEDWAAYVKKMETSEFPCEQEMFYEDNCLQHYLDVAYAKAQQDCLCNTNFFEMQSACFECYKVHGMDPPRMDFSIAAAPALETALCSATKPVLYHDALDSVRSSISYIGSYTYVYMENRFVTGIDLYPSQTDVSHYYTAASATTTAVSSGAAQTIGTDGSAASAVTTTAPAINGAVQLKAVGGVAMAFLGVIAAL